MNKTTLLAIFLTAFSSHICAMNAQEEIAQVDAWTQQQIAVFQNLKERFEALYQQAETVYQKRDIRRMIQRTERNIEQLVNPDAHAATARSLFGGGQAQGGNE